MEYNKTYSMNINALSLDQAKKKVKRYKKGDTHKVIVTSIKLNKKMRYGDVKVYTVKYHFRRKK